ncbi:hypothetical protein CsatB_016234 [Cannabis sativa]
MGFFSFIFLITVHFIICRALQSENNESTFSYNEGSSKGPKKWGEIDPHWKICNNGKLQSPIDLLHQKVQDFPNLGEFKTDYKPAPATLINRGHDITVKWKGNAGKININGTNYELSQCHWHHPSEHTFNGSRFDLELHIVHLSSSGDRVVVAITYKYGQPDPFLTKLFEHIKSVDTDLEEKDLGIINPEIIKFGSKEYYRYIGSLTIPPCTEGVIWTIFRKVRTVSREQVCALRNAVHDGFEVNARPTQQLNGRPVWMYTPRGGN